jgi:hypothetical protein
MTFVSMKQYCLHEGGPSNAETFDRHQLEDPSFPAIQPGLDGTEIPMRRDVLQGRGGKQLYPSLLMGQEDS